MKTIPVALRHICFEIANLEKSLKFYTPLFKLTGFKKILDGKGYAGFSDGQLNIFLATSKPRRVNRKRPTGKEFVVSDHLGFLVKSSKEVDRISSHLKKAGFKPLFPAAEYPEFGPGFYAATFCDPDQVVIEFYYRPAVKKTGKK